MVARLTPCLTPISMVNDTGIYEDKTESSAYIIE